MTASTNTFQELCSYNGPSELSKVCWNGETCLLIQPDRSLETSHPGTGVTLGRVMLYKGNPLKGLITSAASWESKHILKGNLESTATHPLLGLPKSPQHSTSGPLVPLIMPEHWTLSLNKTSTVLYNISKILFPLNYMALEGKNHDLYPPNFFRTGISFLY